MPLKNAEHYFDDPPFLEFVMREFERTVDHATGQDLAEFAFGGVPEAIDAYKQSISKKR